MLTFFWNRISSAAHLEYSFAVVNSWHLRHTLQDQFTVGEVEVGELELEGEVTPGELQGFSRTERFCKGNLKKIINMMVRTLSQLSFTVRLFKMKIRSAGGRDGDDEQFARSVSP